MITVSEALDIASTLTIKTFRDMCHGFVVTIDGKVWRNKEGQFMFLTEKDANTSFRNEVRRLVTNVHFVKNTPYPDTMADKKREWAKFKSDIRFEIKYV